MLNVQSRGTTLPQNTAGTPVERDSQTSSATSTKLLCGHLMLAVLVFVTVAVVTANAQYSQPRIFFSDLQSGPKTGGQNNLGAIVTVRGAGFGSTRGTSIVTVGGGAVSRYFSWSDEDCFPIRISSSEREHRCQSCGS